MSSSDESKSPLEHTFAFLILRLWLVLRAFVTGIEKYSATVAQEVPLLDENGAPDPSGIMLTVDKKVYGLQYYQGVPSALSEKFASEPLLPGFLLSAYTAVLGPALILSAMALLIGVGTRISLFVMGLIYVSLTLGLILIKQDGGVAWLGIHVALVAMALTLARHNRFAVLKRF